MDDKLDQGFRPIFEDCEAKSVASDYSRFRDDRAFWFLTPTRIQRQGPDYEALGRAAAFNIELCAKYIKRPKSRIGYADESAYQKWDAIDSRHIMASTFIFGTRTWPADCSIVEIGGGFGNWVRLNSSVIPYRQWTIIDLPFVSKLQQWYLQNEIGPLAEINVELVPTDTYDRWKRDHLGADLVIGSHSLSEMDWGTFCEYFQNVVIKAPLFYYATQRDLPSAALVSRKLGHIREHFSQDAAFLTENDRVANIFFRRN